MVAELRSERGLFFLNRNFIVDKFGSTFIPLKESFVLRFPLGGDLEFKTYWLYDLVVYVVYIGFIFVTWAIYAYSYRVSDHYAEAAMLLKLDTLEIMKLKRKWGTGLSVSLLILRGLI